MHRIKKQIVALIVVAMLTLCSNSLQAAAHKSLPQQKESERASGSKTQKGVRPVTVPIKIRFKASRAQRELQPPTDFIIREDGEEQRILSLRGFDNAPLSLAILIQDDLVPSAANEIKSMAEFIRRLPRGSRVFIGYIRNGSLQVRQKFTTDLERAAKSLRAPIGFASAAPYNPYVEIIEGLRRFESLPTGPRAMLVISDGLDISRGSDISSITQSTDMLRAINEAQRFGVAIYSFYEPSTTTASNANQLLIVSAQGALQRLSEETGGRAYFQGTGAPVSFDPFLRELSVSLAGQFALTYLSTHPKKGFHRIEIIPGTPEVEIDHPAGYTRK